MTLSTRLGTALAGVAWVVLGVTLLSFAHSPDGGDACKPDALWTGGWFFVAPLVALVGLALTLRRSPRRVTGVAANALLLALWAVAVLPLWLLAAIAHGATCGGG
jgi:hypothetical protein